MMYKRGIAVSPGVISGPAFILDTEGFRIPKRFCSIDAVDVEISRFHLALDAVCASIAENQAIASDRLGKQYGAIFGAHLQLLKDPKLIEEVEELIREKCYSPEYATSRVLRRYAKMFESLGNQYFAERAADMFDLEKRLLRNLLGERREELSHIKEPVVVLAHNLTPSETANLNTEFVLGFATEVGGRASHTAILAGALGIPAVVGVGNFLSDIAGGETVIINGTQGEVILEPDETTQETYRVSQERFQSLTQHLESLSNQASVTKDGELIRLMGNIEFPEEVKFCRQRGADGIGLYRTEFLYLEGDVEPTEEVHYNAYSQVLDAFPELPVVIRTLDLGADKIPASFKQLVTGHHDPNLGLRSIRLSLQNLPQFKTQLRAILRAAVKGNVKIMFPLISTMLEFRQAKMIVADVMEDLEEEGIPFQREVEIGMMVEVPAAAVLADEFAAEVDFFSIGTNDLIQYTLACDRSDPAVANLYRSADPSILRLIQNVVQAGESNNISVTVCGQMSSDIIYIPLLVGMGLRQLSVTPHMIPEIKEVLRNLTVPEAVEIAKHALSLQLARDVENYLRGELKNFCPDILM